MRSVYSVSQINTYIQKMFQEDYLLGDVSVSGEISNCKYHSSGHIYFTLKDVNSAISCVMFASSARSLTFRLEDGMAVVVKGGIDTYIRDGKYQIYVKEAVKDGEGVLAAKFEELKRRLKNEGLFDEEFKRPLPKFPKTVGIVTAPTGAAVRDIINISKRRNPYISLILYPAIVQGDEAPDSIVKGIETLENAGVDVIIVGRGGGSLEDLWGFNEEKVAYAVFNSSIPIISAVGHETDFTICDFVSDLRAPTPSAAAELAVPEISQTINEIETFKEALTDKMLQIVSGKRKQSELYSQKLKNLSPSHRIREKRMESARFSDALNNAMEAKIVAARNRMNLYISELKAVSPLDRLNGGLAYVSGTDNKRITTVGNMNKGDSISLRMQDGEAIAVVEEILMKD